ncbi:SRPBCC family protein [Paracoccus sp. (in: a-proteobacteria)]|uniref:SRPBCC family protein n=1 Tax=Paracoccus sp. TaxID=267 RepID=UPI0026DFD021|nr:SRPBCC family protein [Paracoccus sp. (in: a-proteobacteria)]MDO5647563.1 SRPBCC family protein [Paracoccus sp. (in: a-proteobacteria)]
MTHDLIFDTVLDAPRDRVWRCWTEPRLLEQWFCPKPWTVTDAVIDLRAGGEFSTVMHGPDGECFANTGVFLAVDPGRRLVFTDALTPELHPGARAFMVVHVTLSDAGPDGTHTAYHARAMHWTEQARDEHRAMGFHQGWGIAAEQLQELARSL